MFLYHHFVDFADFLRQLIARRGISQAALGRACGVKGPHVNMICQKKATPPLDKLNEMAAALLLTDAEQATFHELALLSHAPAEVRKMVDGLRSDLAGLRQDVADLAAENARLRAKLSKVAHD